VIASPTITTRSFAVPDVSVIAKVVVTLIAAAEGVLLEEIWRMDVTMSKIRVRGRVAFSLWRLGHVNTSEPITKPSFSIP